MKKNKLKFLSSFLLAGILSLSTFSICFANSSKTVGVKDFKQENLNGQQKGNYFYWNSLKFIDGNHQNWYTNKGLNRIWRNMYLHKYLTYDLTPPGERETEILKQYPKGSAQWNKLYNLFHNPANMYEHTNETRWIDFHGNSYMGHTNLKVHSVEENDHSGKNLLSGNYKVTIPPYSDSPNSSIGKMMEWRYLGYTLDGSKIPNPLFPNDGYSDTPWPSEEWDKEFAKNTDLIEESIFDRDPDKIKWVQDYVIPAIQKEEAKYGKTLTNDKDPTTWAKKFSPASDPNNFTGIWSGTGGNGSWFMTVVTPCPPQPNLRLINYKVLNEKGEVIGVYTRDSNSYDQPNDKVDNKLSKNGNTTADINDFNSILMKGEVQPEGRYRIIATVKNMTPPNHNTINDDISLDWGVSTNEKAIQNTASISASHLHGKITPGKLEDGTDRVVITNGDETIPVTGASIIPSGATVTFTKDIEMPSDAMKYFKIGVGVPEQYYRLQDDTDLADNLSYLIFPVHDRNLKMESVSFIDEHGITVPNKKLVPGEKYKVKYLVSYDGKDMPSSADIRIKDVKIRNLKEGSNVVDYIDNDNGEWDIVKKNVKLKNGEMLTLESDNYFIPSEPRVYAEGRVSSIVKYNHDEYLEENDNWGSGKIDAPEEEFDLIPTITVNSENNKCLVNKVGGNQLSDIVVNLDVFNKAPFDNYVTSTKAIVQISGPSIQNSSSIQTTQMVDLKDLHVGLNKGASTITFKNVEVKPINDEIRIHTKVILNPGIKTFETDKPEIINNNTKEIDTLVPVICAPVQKVCEVDWLKNDWVQRFYITHWTGSSCSKHGCHRSYTYWTESKDAYEKLTLNKFDFISKTAKDLQGEVVDLRNPGSYGKIKAGYGFELNIEFNYKTNRLAIEPAEWNHGCSSGQYFSPHVRPVSIPEEVYIKLGTTAIPFKEEISDSAFEHANGKYISNVKKEGYEQLLDCTASGPWYDRTIKCKLKEGNTFGIKSTNKLYIDESTKNGRYPIMLSTNKDFYGLYDVDKHAEHNLCMKKVRYIDVIGGYKDDLKSHVTQ